MPKTLEERIRREMNEFRRKNLVPKILLVGEEAEYELRGFSANYHRWGCEDLGRAFLGMPVVLDHRQDDFRIIGDMRSELVLLRKAATPPKGDAWPGAVIAAEQGGTDEK